MSSRHPARPFFLIGSFGILAAVCLLAGCTATHIVISASPSTAELEVTESVTITAVVTGTNNSEDREVVWSVCDGQGQNCVSGGNSTVGTVVATTADSDGNARAIYTAPSLQPSPPACLSTSDGCAVVVRGKLARFEAACFTTITLHEPPNPVPVLVSLTPDETTEGEPAFTLGVTGSNFILSSVVRWDGGDRTTTFLSDTQLEAAITAADIATAGEADVTVFNPAPGGGESNAAVFTISATSNPVPVITLLTPSNTAEGGPAFTLIVDGSSFISSSVVRWDGSDRTTTFLSSTQVEAAITAADIAAVGTASVTVFNPTPGGGTSNALTFTITPAIGAVERVSVASDGSEATSESRDPSATPDGRFVAFWSAASNLVSGDTNGTDDAIVHDRDADENGIFDETCVGCRTTVRVSVADDGTQGNASSRTHTSGARCISGDGRFVVFRSFATNLVAGSDTNGVEDIFLHDRDADENGIFDETCAGCRKTVRISEASDGTVGNGFSDLGALSDDGRYVAFESGASNLVTADTNGQRDIVVHDRDADEDGIFDETGVGERAAVIVSVASDGTAANSISSRPSLNASGRFVSFNSGATNLVTGDTNGQIDIFVHDRDADENGIFDETCAGCRKTVRVSVASDGTQGNGAATDNDGQITEDGRFVTFESGATNLVAGDTNGVLDVFIHDRDTDEDGIFDEAGFITTVRVSVAGDGSEGNGASDRVKPTSDGRFVAFRSFATNLVAGDINGVEDIFLHDRDADENGIFDETCGGCRETTRLSVASDGTEGNDSSTEVAFSADRRWAAFASRASNLVPGDANGIIDIFVAFLGIP